jgi:hypothetical protein
MFDAVREAFERVTRRVIDSQMAMQRLASSISLRSGSQLPAASSPGTRQRRRRLKERRTRGGGK